MNKTLYGSVDVVKHCFDYLPTPVYWIRLRDNNYCYTDVLWTTNLNLVRDVERVLWNAFGEISHLCGLDSLADEENPFIHSVTKTDISPKEVN